MGNFPAIKPKELLTLLEKRGFYVHRTKGSHALLKSREDSSIRVTVPLHGKDLKRGTILSILSQAGMSKEELIKIIRSI